MKRIFTLLLLTAILSACSHTPTRSEIIEQKATAYLTRTTKPMSSYTIVGKGTQSDDSIFVGFIGYRCSIENNYSIYKVVFVGMHGDSVVYVGTNEETAKRITYK